MYIWQNQKGFVEVEKERVDGKDVVEMVEEAVEMEEVEVA
jgi:hypothetical protein